MFHNTLHCETMSYPLSAMESSFGDHNPIVTKKSAISLHDNQNGFGLIAAIFVIVILATFGLLVARFTGIGSQQSAEDYLWAQALYSANATAQLAILYNDKNGASTPPAVTVAGFTNTITTPLPLPAQGNPATLGVRASRANIVREIQVKYIL